MCYGTKEAFDVSTYEPLYASVNRIVKILLESDYETAINYKSVIAKRDDTTSKAKNLFNGIQTNYNSCLNVAEMENRGLSPLYEVRDEIRKLLPVADLNSNLTIAGSEPISCSSLSGSPPTPPSSTAVATDSKATNATIGAVLLYMSQIEVVNTVGLSLHVRQNPFAPGQNVVALSPLAPDVYLSNLPQGKAEARTVGKDIGDLLWDLFSDDQQRDEIDFVTLGHAVVYFQAQIGRIIDSRSKTDNQTQTLMTLKDMASLAPFLGIDAVIRELVPAVAHNDKFLVDSPSTVASISRFISTTPAAVIQAYLLYQMIKSFQDFVWVPILDEKTTGSQRRTTCFNNALETGPSKLLGQMFLMAAVPQESRDKGVNILNQIKRQFVDSLKTRDWISADVKTRIEQKVSQMKHEFGTSPKYDGLDKITTLYSDLTLTNDYLKNQLAYRKWDTKQHFSQAGKPLNISHETVPTGAGAFYELVANTISVDGLFLRHPVASKDYPDVFNFGGLGRVLGHELGHGFGTGGIYFDANGRYGKWWDNKTIGEFNKRAQCFVDQYNAYSLPTPEGQKNVNGLQTVEENIADATGINLAFDAWKTARKPHDKKIQGLDHFTPEQQFFIASMVVLCTTNRREKNLKDIMFAHHAPSAARIQGSLENSRAFREAFNCPKKTPRCELW
ncbi:hypothetical protein CP533_4949 [Ophiocordyceps camponoti-saundersi (nom. inval.)]|nr:hypothetical protein CP533_4949 [Ophiocordyceps camponoti-saundersi (nom. inval.)]